MPPQDLLDFTKQGLSAGKQPLEVQAEAMQLGKWSQEEISDAVNHAILNTSPTTPVLENSQSAFAPNAGLESSTLAPVRSGSWFSRHKKMVTAFVLVGLLAAGGIYAASVYLMAPSTNKIGEKILQNLEQAETMEYSGTIEGEVISDAFLSLSNISKYGFQDEYPDNPKIAGSQNTSVKIEFNGATDARDQQNPKTEFSFTVAADGFVFSLQTKSVGQDIYLRLMEFPRLGIIELDEHLGQWYKFDIDGVAGMEFETQKQFDPELQKKAAEIFKKHKIFTIAESLGSDKVDDKTAYHYRYSVDANALLALIEESVGLMGGSDDPSLDEAASDWFEFSGGDIWLSKKDLAPLRVTFGLTMKSIEENPVSGKLKADIKIKSLNADVNIQAPESFKSLNEVVEEYFPEISGSMARDTARLNDIRRAMIALEIYYNDTGEYPSSFGALFPEYLTQPMPTPTPPDGDCTEEQNNYRYQAGPENQTYTLTFCLGTESGAYSPGVRTASPNGLK